MSQKEPPNRAEKYDAFISYRRESGAAEARLIRSELRERKIRAFLDVDDLKSGHFDEALLSRIADAPNFIVILSPNALERCSDERDWLRREIVQALKSQRNIIPVLLRGFSFPDRETLPEDLRTLSSHNGVEYSHNYFNATIGAIMSFLRMDGKPASDQELAISSRGSSSDSQSLIQSTSTSAKEGLSAPIVETKPDAKLAPAGAESQKSGGKPLVLLAGLVISAFAGLIGYRFVASLLGLIITEVGGLSFAKSQQLYAVLGPICGFGSMAVVFIFYVVYFWKDKGKKKRS